MLKKIIINIIIFTSISLAQSTRGLNNDGVDYYKDKKFDKAEEQFKKSLENEFELFEGHFNLGDALYKREKYDESIQSFQNALAFAKDDYYKSKVNYNIGNSFLKLKKYKEAIEAYKNSLKKYPNDSECKYNLSYALKQMEKKQKQNKQNQQNKQKKDNKNKDQNKDKQKQDNKQNKQDQNKNDKQKQDQPKDQKQNPKPKISKEEAKRILNALKNNEAELQKKLRKKKGKAVKREKDW